MQDRGDMEVTIEIGTGKVVGAITKRALRMVFDWMEIHQDEVKENWEQARKRKPLNPTEPLR